MKDFLPTPRSMLGYHLDKSKGCPLTEFEAHSWLLRRAAWGKGLTIPARQGKGTVKVGDRQVGDSLRFLSQEWCWHISKVRRFIACLETDGWLVKHVVKGRMVLSLCNEYRKPAAVSADTTSDTPKSLKYKENVAGRDTPSDTKYKTSITNEAEKAVEAFADATAEQDYSSAGNLEDPRDAASAPISPQIEHPAAPFGCKPKPLPPSRLQFCTSCFNSRELTECSDARLDAEWTCEECLANPKSGKDEIEPLDEEAGGEPDDNVPDPALGEPSEAPEW